MDSTDREAQQSLSEGAKYLEAKVIISYPHSSFAVHPRDLTRLLLVCCSFFARSLSFM